MNAANINPIAERLDLASATVTYFGQAPAGSSESAEVWLISRATTTGNVTKTEWSDVNGGLRFAWANRASLTYI
jgi:hypothetical protein